MAEDFERVMADTFQEGEHRSAAGSLALSEATMGEAAWWSLYYGPETLVLEWTLSALVYGLSERASVEAAVTSLSLRYELEPKKEMRGLQALLESPQVGWWSSSAGRS